MRTPAGLRDQVSGYPRWIAEGKYVLVNFDMTVIAPIELKRTWRQRGFGGFKFDMSSWSCVIGGKRYAGRNAGAGMILNLREVTK